MVGVSEFNCFGSVCVANSVIACAKILRQVQGRHLEHFGAIFQLYYSVSLRGLIPNYRDMLG